jgi:hypothetical protein
MAPRGPKYLQTKDPQDAASQIQIVEDNMFGIIGIVLLLMWLAGFFAFHVTAGFIHILLVLAIISIVYHFFAGRSATA